MCQASLKAPRTLWLIRQHSLGPRDLSGMCRIFLRCGSETPGVVVKHGDATPSVRPTPVYQIGNFEITAQEYVFMKKCPV